MHPMEEHVLDGTGITEPTYLLVRNTREDHPMMQAVKISSGLIAVLPKKVDQNQPYVVLLNPENGRMAKVDFSSSGKVRSRPAIH